MPFYPEILLISDKAVLWLTRIIHETFTAEAYMGMSTAFRSLGLLDALSSATPGPSVASLVSTPIYTSSLQTFMNNPG